jgi:putative transposase
MIFQRSNGHTVSRLTVHIVWSTKYRYPVIVGDIKVRYRTLLIQICESEDVQILKGVVSKDHIHMHIEYRLSQNISTLIKLMKGRTSRKLQMEFPDLKKRYWGRHF